MKSPHLHLLIGGLLLFITSLSNAQNRTSGQTARGFIVDRASGNGIRNAVIELLNHSPRLTAQTNEDGSFSLEQVSNNHRGIL
jgi:hypothetical protein